MKRFLTMAAVLFAFAVGATTLTATPQYDVPPLNVPSQMNLTEAVYACTGGCDLVCEDQGACITCIPVLGGWWGQYVTGNGDTHWHAESD